MAAAYPNGNAAAALAAVAGNGHGQDQGGGGGGYQDDDEEGGGAGPSTSTGAPAGYRPLGPIKALATLGLNFDELNVSDEVRAGGVCRGALAPQPGVDAGPPGCAGWHGPGPPSPSAQARYTRAWCPHDWPLSANAPRPSTVARDGALRIQGGGAAGGLPAAGGGRGGSGDAGEDSAV